MLVHGAAARVGQLRRQLDRHRLGAPDPSPMRREQPRIDPVMAGNHLVNLFQRDRPPRQIKIFILPAAAPPLFNRLLGSIAERRSADLVKAYSSTT